MRHCRDGHEHEIHPLVRGVGVCRFLGVAVVNVDLLPPTFARAEPPAPEHRCCECSSWREHFNFSGWCLMYSRPRGAVQTPDNIGGRNLWISCFSPITHIPQCEISGGGGRYGSVTRTENDMDVVYNAKRGVNA